MEKSDIASRLGRTPKLIHFIFLSESESLEIPLIYYVAIKSAKKVNPDYDIIFHSNIRPEGVLWTLARDFVSLRHISAPSHVFGQEVHRIQHKVDVLRLEILLELGGVYLDLDTVCVRPLDRFLTGKTVLGKESDEGLCNAVIIAPPQSQFVRAWHDGYRTFHNDQWNEFSVELPFRLSSKMTDSLQIEQRETFFWPSFSPDSLQELFVKSKEFPEAYVFHLWKSAAQNYIRSITARSIAGTNSTYNSIARAVLEGDLALLLGEVAAPLSVVRAGPGQGEQKMVFLTSWRMKHRQEFFGPLLPANAVVFDIGANHGEYTAAFLSVGARRVVAIEPQSTAANFIIEAFPNEIQTGALIVRTHAIGASKGVGRLFPANDPGMSMSTLSKQFVDVSVQNGRQWDEEKLYEVEINTLDCLIDEIGIPDYVKIDVEGYDFEVLSGLSRPIPLLSFEFNTNPGLIEIAEKCTSYIGKLGGYEFNYQAEASGETAVQFTKWVSPGVMLYTLRYDLARKEMFGDIFARLKGL